MLHYKIKLLKHKQKSFLKVRSEFMKVHGLTELQIKSWLLGNGNSQRLCTAPKLIYYLPHSHIPQGVGNGSLCIVPVAGTKITALNSYWTQFEIQVSLI